MCLTTKQKWPKIAWRPITVYKVVCGWEDPYRTIYLKAKIQIGKTYRESVYNILKNKQCFTCLDDETKYYRFHEGIHSVIEKDAAQIISTYFDVLYPTEIVECTIPRFSLYWIGVDNDIVSNKLKYVKIL